MPKRILKQIAYVFPLLSFVATTNVYAVASGFYVGAQGAYAKLNDQPLNAKDVPTDATVVSNNNKLLNMLIRSTNAGIPNVQILATPSSFTVPSIAAFTTDTGSNTFLGRFFFGYQFLPWIGAEMGFSGTGSVDKDYKAIASGIATANVKYVNGAPFNGTFTANYNTINRSDDTTKQTVDFFVKLMLPFYDIFDVYLKLGGAWVHTTVNTEIKIDAFRNGFFATPPGIPNPFPGNGTYISTASLKVKTKDTASNVAPAYSIGISYYYQQNLGIDLSFTQIKGGNSTDMNYIALGIAYHLVDKYCGQFLCD